MKKRFFINIVTIGLAVSVAGCGSIEAAELADLKMSSVETVNVDLHGTDAGEEAASNNSDASESASDSGGAESMSVEEQGTEYTYCEGKELMLVVEPNSNADEKDRIDVNAMSLLQTYTHVTITDEIYVYFSDGTPAGYTKIGANPVWISSDDKWCSLAFVDGTYFVKKDEFWNAMEEGSNKDDSSSEAVSASMGENDSAAEDASETEAYTVTDLEKLMFVQKSVNVRSGPGADYGKVGSLSVNQEVAVTGQAENGWYRFSYNGEEAFVSDKYLADDKVEVAVADVNTPEGKKTEQSNVSVPSEPVVGSMPSVAEVTEPEQQPEVQPTPEPETPVKMYSEEEVISIVESALRKAGLRKPEEDMTEEELAMFGPTDGMGWGISNIPMDDPYTAADGLVEGAQFRGYEYYYIESLGVSNGKVSLKMYGG